jgi:SHS2 domain-containing protein
VTLAGVAFLDHTADVGIDVEASSLAELLHRAALGMLALLRGEEEDGQEPGPPDGSASHAAAGGSLARPGPRPGSAGPAGLETVPVDVHGAGPVDLLAGWLREILFLHEVERLDYVRAELDVVGPDRLAGRIFAGAGGHAVREIKGVTYHELEATERSGGRWYARVIFDV